MGRVRVRVAVAGSSRSRQLITALGFLLGDFNRWIFFALLLAMGTGMGLFVAPTTTSSMNSVPAEARGVASGRRGTFQNAGQMASIAFFFSVLTASLAARLPDVMYRDLISNGLLADLSRHIAALPPISVLFAAFLGYNPMQTLIPAAPLHRLGAHAQPVLAGKAFFPNLILPVFMEGLRLAFYASACASGGQRLPSTG